MADARQGHRVEETSGERIYRLREEAGECGCREVREPSRRIDVEVTRCTMCPFMVRYEQAHGVRVIDDEGVTTQDGTVAKGWYCLHPRYRNSDDPIATHQMVLDSPEHVTGLDSWLKHHVGGLFPHFCPLARPVVLESPGKRTIDVS